MNRVLSGASVIAVLAASVLDHAQSKPPIRFEITVPSSIRSDPITGRVYVMITRNGEREPRLQLNQADGIPFFGRDVERLKLGVAAYIDDSDLGFPVGSMREIPPGEYFVQAFVNLYSEFKRADGHVVWMHDDQWEGQHWETSPGNLYSRPQRIRLRRIEGLSGSDHSGPDDSNGHDSAGHDVRKAHQVSEPDAHEILGSAGVPRRNGALAA